MCALRTKFKTDEMMQHLVLFHNCFEVIWA